MGIFSSKQELERNIKELNKKVEALSGEKEAQINEIKKIKNGCCSFNKCQQ